jgi:hypothetical protein
LPPLHWPGCISNERPGFYIAVAVALRRPPSSRKIKGRRNVSEIDRIMLASKREEIVARKAKANLSHKIPGRKGNSPLANLPKVNTRHECAKAAGVGERTEPSNHPATHHQQPARAF